MSRLNILFSIFIFCTTMPLFGFLKQNRQSRFVSEADYNTNINRQENGVPAVLNQLNVPPDKTLMLEYFFYTDAVEKAHALSAELKQLHYSVIAREAAGNQKLFVVTGWTTPIKMDVKTVSTWSKEMCQIGYKYDCDFDGWGTDPSQ